MERRRLDLRFRHSEPSGWPDPCAERLVQPEKGAPARLLAEGPVDGSKVKDKKAGFDVRNVFGLSQAHPDLAREFWKRLPGISRPIKLNRPDML